MATFLLSHLSKTAMSTTSKRRAAPANPLASWIIPLAVPSR